MWISFHSANDFFSSDNYAVFCLLIKQFDLKQSVAPNFNHKHIQRYIHILRLIKNKMSLSSEIAAPIMSLSVWTLESTTRQFKYALASVCAAVSNCRYSVDSALKLLPLNLMQPSQDWWHSKSIRLLKQLSWKVIRQFHKAQLIIHVIFYQPIIFLAFHINKGWKARGGSILYVW